MTSLGARSPGSSLLWPGEPFASSKTAMVMLRIWTLFPQVFHKKIMFGALARSLQCHS